VFFILILNILRVLTILFQIFSLVNFCGATIASKKDKEKMDSKALVLKPESTIVASLVIYSIALINRLSAFGPGDIYIYIYFKDIFFGKC
jgi:hypothetical protein